MTIQIKELVVNTTVSKETNRSGGENKGSDASNDLEAIKAKMLAECRNLVYELLNEQKER